MRRQSQRLIWRESGCGIVRLAAWRRAALPSCLALQDVRRQSLQFGCPVCGGYRRPQEEL